MKGFKFFQWIERLYKKIISVAWQLPAFNILCLFYLWSFSTKDVRKIGFSVIGVRNFWLEIVLFLEIWFRFNIPFFNLHKILVNLISRYLKHRVFWWFIQNYRGGVVCFSFNPNNFYCLLNEFNKETSNKTLFNIDRNRTNNNKKVTVQETPPYKSTVPNWNACGIANAKARIQMAKIKRTTLDNLDMVWDLKKRIKMMMKGSWKFSFHELGCVY